MQSQLGQRCAGGGCLHLAEAAPQHKQVRSLFETRKSGAAYASASLEALSSSLVRRGKKVRSRCPECKGRHDRRKSKLNQQRDFRENRFSPQAVAEVDSAEASTSSGEEAGSRNGLYKAFVDYAVETLGKKMELWPYPIKDEFIRLEATDSKGQRAVTDSTYLQSEKLRQVRACNIQAGSNLQVLNLIAFPRPEYDLPYFCADLVTLPRGHLQILCVVPPHALCYSVLLSALCSGPVRKDLNPLHKTQEHLDKHIKPMLPITNRYIEVLPWGGEFTAESLQFFSPALLWTRPSDETTVRTTIFEAFKEYIDAYAEMVAKAVPTTDPAEIARNREAQHKYISWRTEKDPGRPVITRLYGTELCEAYIHGFLFDGLKEMGTKTFLDYFPEYRGPDGEVIRKRSVVGKKCVTRPWDLDGNFMPPT